MSEHKTDSKDRTRPFNSLERELFEDGADQRFQDLQADLAAQRQWGTHGDMSTEFIRIVPQNRPAKIAFSEVAKSDGVNEHHRRYIHVTGKETIPKGYQAADRSEEDSPIEEPSDREDEIEVESGYFGLSFDHPSIVSGIRWVMGRGTSRNHAGEKRQVDILLTPPRHKLAAYVDPAHALLIMNTTSGAWLLGAGKERISSKSKVSDPQGAQASRSAEAAPVQIDDENIGYDEYRCLTKYETRFSVAHLKYLVRFNVDDTEKEAKYRSHRNDVLRQRKLRIPDTRISGIPFEGDVRVKSLAVCRDGISWGTFGSVYEGFDVVTGDLRVVKEIEVKKEYQISNVMDEIKANEALRNQEGLLHFYDWRTSRGDQMETAPSYPSKLHLVLEKGKDFRQHSGPNSGMEWKHRRRLLKNLLQGLATIHAKGWMHRDITPQNLLLVLRDGTTQAVLCDFGKLHTLPTDSETRLAAWEFLPPEISPQYQHEYNQSIDIYMLAQALLISWYPDIAGNLDRRRKSNNDTIVNALRQQQTNIGSLLSCMLAWVPSRRITASKALSLGMFKDIIAEDSKIQKTSEKKREREEEK